MYKKLRKGIFVVLYKNNSMLKQSNNPLENKTLQVILEFLVEYYGFTELSVRIPINCFTHDPSISSSLTFLRRTPWARKKIESLYIYTTRMVAKKKQQKIVIE
jgi:uncharacterized protein (DUF2132 family)